MTCAYARVFGRDQRLVPAPTTTKQRVVH